MDELMVLIQKGLIICSECNCSILFRLLQEWLMVNYLPFRLYLVSMYHSFQSSCIAFWELLSMSLLVSISIFNFQLKGRS